MNFRPPQTRLLVALALCLALALTTGCGCGSKPAGDRPMPPEKLKVYVPQSIPGMARKTAAKHDDVKDDFAVVYQDLQNNQGDSFHITLRDYAEDSFGERFPSQSDPKWKKFAHKGYPARELSPHKGKPTIEVMIGTRYLITISGDEEKNRQIPLKVLLMILDSFDLEALKNGTPPQPQKVEAVATGPSGKPGTGSTGGPSGAVDSSEPTPLYSPAPRPSGKPNWLTTRIELALSKIEDQEKEISAEVVRLEKALKAAGRAGNAGISRSIAAQKVKFEEVRKRDLETRRDLEKAYANPPPDPTKSAPPPTPVPTKPPEPTLHEKWMAQVTPLVKALTPDKAGDEEVKKGQAIIDILTKLPVDEKKTEDWHLAMAQALHSARQSIAAADTLLALSAVSTGKHPEMVPVRTWLKKQAGMQYVVAMAGVKVKDPSHANKAYLAAVRLDPTILQKEDQGLRERALKALRGVVEKNKNRVDLLFLLGVYSYAIGELGTATSTFQDCVVRDTDPYNKWRAESWLKKISKN